MRSHHHPATHEPDAVGKGATEPADASEPADATTEEPGDPSNEIDDTIINTPEPPASKKYIDLELARLNPPA